MNRREFLKTVISIAGGTALLGTYTVFIERYLVQFNHYRIRIPRLPKPFSGLKILHISDIHYGELVPLGFVSKLLEKVAAIPKDIIVCTGDFVHARRTTREIEAVWPLLSKLKAPLGVYSVLGNHDHWADTERTLYWMQKCGQSMRGRTASLSRKGEHLWISGAGDLWEDHLSLDEVLHQIPPEECRIVLAHNPDTADTDYTAAVDLMLSGHTHGGQVRIPFYGPVLLPVKNKKYSSGILTSDRGFPLFISRGIGWALYPVRFNCLPEIAVIELIS